MQETGKYIIYIGIGIILIGAIIYFFGNKFSFFGKLPGDIRIENENFSFYMPITSMILLSIVISGVLWLIRKFF